MITRLRIMVSLLTASIVGPLALASGIPTGAANGAAPQIVALPGYTVSVWARGTAAYSKPDSILSDGQHVYVGYQNVTAKDGSDHKTSTVVEYTLQGTVVRTVAVLGHCDGLRMNPVTHLLWALSDEDGNPHLTTIDPASGTTHLYAFGKTSHGGGFDDIAFTNGLAFIDASNPTLDKNGANVFPALDEAVLSNGQVQLKPVLMGNGSSLDITAGNNKTVALNLIDPDSMTFDPAGELVLDNQAGTQLVFIKGPGTTKQAVRSLVLGDAVDDSIWPTSTTGQFLISDTGSNAIIALRSTSLSTSTLYATTPNDSGVAGFVGSINLSTGIITPVAIGLTSPHGMTFLPGTV